MYPVKYFLNTDYEPMELLGVQGLFSNLRVENDSLPEGFYKYSIREGEDDFLSSVEKSVTVNHSGDFICKTPLDLGPDGYKSLEGDYSFLLEDFNLDEFFGVDILDKVAEALDSFMREVAPYEYADNLSVGENLASENADQIRQIRESLNNREQTEGIFKELSEICEEVEFADAKSTNLAFSLKHKVEEIMEAFPARLKKEPVTKDSFVVEAVEKVVNAKDTEVFDSIDDFFNYMFSEFIDESYFVRAFVEKMTPQMKEEMVFNEEWVGGVAKVNGKYLYSPGLDGNYREDGTMIVTKTNNSLESTDRIFVQSADSKKASLDVQIAAAQSKPGPVESADRRPDKEIKQNGFEL